MILRRSCGTASREAAPSLRHQWQVRWLRAHRNSGGAFRVHFPFQTHKYETGFGQFGSIPCPLVASVAGRITSNWIVPAHYFRKMEASCLTSDWDLGGAELSFHQSG